MRRRYWESPTRTVEELALKLAEECGEVSKAVLLDDKKNLDMELEHVAHIVKCLRRKARVR